MAVTTEDIVKKIWSERPLAIPANGKAVVIPSATKSGILKGPVLFFDINKQAELVKFYMNIKAVHTNKKSLAIGVGVCMLVSGGFMVVGKLLAKVLGGPTPKTLTKEWRKAEAELRTQQGYDAISRHKIGKPFNGYGKD